MKKRVMIGMSGGVDSSVAAYLLKEQGYDVIGVTMQIWQNEDDDVIENEGGCCSLSAVEDARKVADKIGIPFYVMNFKDIFKEKVIDYFIDEYLVGRTPNPCIACNKHIKFDEFLKRAKKVGCDYVATGHYAKIEFDETLNRYLLKKSITDEKDQTYALYNMTQYQLSHTLMPLGYYTKDKIRQIAKEIGLDVANKPDSQEICFVKDNDYARYVKEHSKVKIKEGNFVDKNGKILGKHKGIINYTIGQRKGLGIALGKPMFVVDIIPEKNLVVLGEHDEVFSNELIASDVNIILFDEIKEPIKVKAKIRYSAPPKEATVFNEGNGKIRIVFDQMQRAITPGQSVVMYKDDIVVGGGIIEKRL
ncbi:tRNA-specific 2-thiouridylase [Alkalithermobacter thermoalcaliphilus JW-YL-7 = DSM 7308]|uniref:tRNA-specific 2-thiouridylase MnmA n=1 Tax=Alkalithermobacter thermoalcaliphilus JW-YL-7 = DSM 7308 TaxID=1121328 RepID=A0A150FQT6_CLOPD|nr:tRNA-specific 2-thiouridylase mnmA [[Clostridium] paradoxum JW-YL-7 = DSM 7308]SHK76051.1 tRNA-specific 2-thiouridylase [[Clostridium] paradoxum JW-YL-7 = DSM 7308]